MRPALMFDCWSKEYEWLGPVAPLQASVMARYGAPGEASFSLDADDDRVDDLASDGARVVVTFLTDESDPDSGVPLYSGPVTGADGAGLRDASTRTFHVTDDWDEIFNGLICLPNPTGGDAEQGDDGAYYVSTGPAETVLLDVVSKSLYGTQLTLPASQDRGDTVTVKLRNHTLADRLWPAIEQAGIGCRVLQHDAERRLDIVIPADFPLTVTEDSGQITDGSWQTDTEMVTRVMVAAGGEGEARLMHRYIDSALEERLGRIRWAYVDARDIAVDAPDAAAQMQARADQAFLDGAARAGLSVLLEDGGILQFEDTWRLGDRVPVQMAGAPVITDHFRAVKVDLSPDEGLTVGPVVGDWSEPSVNDDLYAAVADMQVGLADVQRSR